MYKNPLSNTQNSEIDEIEKQVFKFCNEIMKQVVNIKSKNQSVIYQNHENLQTNPKPKKEIFTIDDLVEYSGLSRSSIYKKTMNREIPHYKVNRKLYFNYEEIKNWFLSNKIESRDEIINKIRKIS